MLRRCVLLLLASLLVFGDDVDYGNRTISREQCNNQTDHFLCNNGRCISLNQTCDGIDNCGDDSDENATECPNFEELCKKRMGCSHYCNETSNGLMCSCPVAYRLVDSQTCIDVDECSENSSLCDQQCINTPGSYYCACSHGYELLDDLRTCKAMGDEALLIYSSDRSGSSFISGVYLDSMNSYETFISKEDSFIKNVWMNANGTYWTELKEMNWKILKKNIYSDEEVIIDNGLGQVEQIAVDFITGNIYFTDSGWKRIGVCQNDGKYCTLILSEFVNTPYGLALNPMNGEMFWSDIGNTSRILRARMDGKNAEELVTEDLGSPKNLAIDYPNARLYWADDELGRIESVRFDGTDRRRVLHTTDSIPHSMAIFENKLYWSDWATETVESADKYTGANRKTVLPINIHSIMFYDPNIHIHHPVFNPELPNPCSSQPCSELCLLAQNNEYSCACTPGKELNWDRNTCKTMKKNQHLMIVTNNAIMNYSINILGTPKMTGNQTLEYGTFVTYDSITDTIIAQNLVLNSILRMNPTDTMNRTLIARTSIRNLVGVDFDYYGNNIYWSDPERRTIEIYSLETHEKTVFDYIDEPHEILVTPKYGWMYVVFYSSDKYHIDRVLMSNGESSRSLVEGSGRPIISLAYDPGTKRMFWSNTDSGKIESISVEGNVDRRVLRAGISSPGSLAIGGPNIYWISNRLNDYYTWIEYTDKLDRVPGTKSFRVSAKYGNPVKLITVPKSSTNRRPSCRTSERRCSHVCLAPIDRQESVCACPPGMTLSNYVSCRSILPDGEKKTGLNDYGYRTTTSDYYRQYQPYGAVYQTTNDYQSYDDDY